MGALAKKLPPFPSSPQPIPRSLFIMLEVKKCDVLVLALAALVASASSAAVNSTVQSYCAPKLTMFNDTNCDVSNRSSFLGYDHEPAGIEGCSQIDDLMSVYI